MQTCRSLSKPAAKLWGQDLAAATNCKALVGPYTIRSPVFVEPHLWPRPEWTAQPQAARYIRVRDNFGALDFGEQVKTKYSSEFSVHRLRLISQ